MEAAGAKVYTEEDYYNLREKAIVEPDISVICDSNGLFPRKSLPKSL